MATTTIDFRKADLAPMFNGDRNRAQGDPQLRHLVAETQVADGIFNPFKRHGYLSPANQSYKRITPTGTLLTYGSVPRVFANATNVSGESVMLAGTRFWQATGDNFTTLSSDATSIHGDTTTWPMDLELYYINGVSGRTFMLTSDTSGTDGKLRYYNHGADTYTTVQSSLVLDEYSCLARADNGFMYVIGQNRVHKFDGTEAAGASGLFTSNVLVFPSKLALRGGIDYRGVMFMGVVGWETTGGSGLMDNTVSYRSVPVSTSSLPIYAGVFLWDRLSTTVRMRDFIEIPNIQNLVGFHISPLGTLRVYGISNHRTTQLLEWSGTKFNIIRELGPQAYPAQPKGVRTSGLFTYWLGQDGYVYCIGRASALDEKEQLAKILDVNAVAADMCGVVGTTISLAGAVLPASFQNTGQVDTTDRIDHESLLIGFQYSNGPSVTCAMTIASPAVVTASAHGLGVGDSIKFSTTGALPTGLTAGTTYYVISAGLSADDFRVSASAGGSAINTSGTQSGVHSFRKTVSNEVIRVFPFTNQTLQSVTPKANIGNVYSGVKYFKRLSTIKHIDFYCAPGTTSGTDTVATIKFYANQSTTAFSTKTVTRNDLVKGYKSIDLNKLWVNALQIEIEFETTQTLGPNDFAPAMAVVEYEDSVQATERTGD
jgi:hypothetical protein